jgi:methylphosphotriester-DNA--protein-cysteine methyltransferase
MQTNYWEEILTPEDRQQAVRLLVDFKNRLYQQGNAKKLSGFLAQLPEYFHYWFKEKFSLQKKSINPDQFAQQVEQLIKEIKALETAELKIGYRPSSRQIQELTSLLREKLDQKLLLKTVYDCTQIPGCSLLYQGRKWQVGGINV